MKRYVLAVLAMVFLAGCGGGNGSDESGSTPANTGSAPASTIPGAGQYPPAASADPTYIGTYAAVAGNNVVPVYFESGNSPTYNSNIPYIDVQICVPGTSQCVRVDHVQVDSGSTGLRIMKSALNGLTLPLQANTSGAQISECMAYATSEVWGPVARSDVYVGGEFGGNQTLQVIDDSDSASVPASCSSQGALTDTTSSFGGKGIIGINQLFSDGGSYYACTGTGCSQLDSSPVTVTNPVAGFAQDNNGVSIQIQPISDLGATSASGQLIFGINTASNNRIAGAAILYTDKNGDLSVNTGTRTMPGFIDSGTASYFFPDDGSIPICSDNRNWYCPPSPISVNVDVIAGDASVDRPSSYRLSSYDSISADMEVAPTGESGSVFNDGASWYVLGLPFYINRRVYGSIQQSDSDPMYYAF
ncbi:DUF3443 family protein [Burkholderia pseudomallei]|uniref:DUF3443 family protein n=1 Tax=Burkholderia pseudomallei TaxID=28450 RepID=UPI000F1BD7EC|nr:DUF3443 family protein [Burkholderia pseudomallei]CAJ5476421.1 ppe-repeat protein [Burkholderia pseudomallei]VBI28905.1 ppe-repeat protein [Burkholderia pseudomallei]VBJ78440.1 ppe-repeat protein [Burkholderia pseudomallei]VBO72904.1 ppe-repeat protein [Burkholderia pseudomallei]VBP13859.1 ppe-repeat protein [Burkholderia pseudomallei]